MTVWKTGVRYPTTVTLALATTAQPNIQWALSQRIKQQNVNTITHFHSEFKYVWSFTSKFSIQIHGVMLRYRARFTFHLHI